jgi:hypothetical protein
MVAMYEPQPLSLLLSQAYEIRLAIYSHIDLPPFDGHEEYFSFFLACHQLKHELERETRLWLKAYLAKVERKVVAEYQEQKGVEPVADAVALQTIQISQSRSPKGFPELSATVPLYLPQFQHDWHHFLYSKYEGGCFYEPVSYLSERAQRTRKRLRAKGQESPRSTAGYVWSSLCALRASYLFARQSEGTYQWWRKIDSNVAAAGASCVRFCRYH